MSPYKNRKRPTVQATRAKHSDPTKPKIVRKDDSGRVGRGGTGRNREIVREDEKSAVGQELTAEIAEAATGLPQLPKLQRLEKRLLVAGARDAEVYARQLKPRVALMVGVGHEALYRAIEVVACLHALLKKAPKPRADALRGYLGVKLESARPVNALINGLFGLPSAELDGGEARRAAQTRHSKYAMAIRGAEMLGIPPDGVAAALHSDRGLYGLAEVARRPAAKAEVETENDDDADGGSEPQEDRRGSDADRKASEPVNDRDDEEAAPTPPGRRTGSCRQSEAAADQPVYVELTACAEDAERLRAGDGIAVLVVDRDIDPPELLGGAPLPQHLRHDGAAAYAWVQAIIKAADEADQSDEDNDVEEVDDES